MNEEFVPFELAKKLKENGYNKPFYFYHRTDDQHIHHVNTVSPLIYSDKIDDEVIIAPTISQVLKWLREEKNLCVEVLISVRGGWYNIIYEIAPRRGFDLKHMLIEEKSYEDAAIAGIEYVLDNLI